MFKFQRQAQVNNFIKMIKKRDWRELTYSSSARCSGAGSLGFKCIESFDSKLKLKFNLLNTKLNFEVQTLNEEPNWPSHSQLEATEASLLKHFDRIWDSESEVLNLAKEANWRKTGERLSMQSSKVSNSRARLGGHS